MKNQKPQIKREAKSELLKNLAERYPDYDLETIELVSNIQSVVNTMNAQRDQILEPHGLSQGKLYVLIYLINEEVMHHDNPSPSEIADGLEVTPATVTGLLDGLERSGFVERCPHPQDRRALTIHLTPKSRQFLDEYMPMQSRQVNDWLAVLEPAERTTLATLLAKLTQAEP